MSEIGRAEELEALVALVREVGELGRSLQGQVSATVKADGSLATQADVAVEEFLRERLSEAYPGDTIIGEEGLGRERVGQGRVWSLDPIDGTHNYIAGLDLWAVSVGLIEGGRPALGVVHAPSLKQTFAAAAGEGAWFNGERMVPPPAGPLRPTDLVALTSLSWGRALRLPHKGRCVGSAALHACWVAAGFFRAALLTNWALWDLAASLCVAAETEVEAIWPEGGRLEDLAELSAIGRYELIVLAPRGMGEGLVAALEPERGR